MSVAEKIKTEKKEIIQPKKMGLLVENPVYKPFRYPWCYDAWLTQQRIHWLPEEVPLGDDVRDWQKNLTQSEKNLLTQILSDQLIKTNPNIASTIPLDLTIGIIIALIVSIVIFGGLQRIADVASRIVPFMVIVYLSAGLFIVFSNIALVPSIFNLIISSAFNGSSVAGGFVGTAVVISQGFRRAAFSNEAGMGTEVMAIGASKNNEPIRSGLVAMIGPVIDTIIVCTITGIVILLSGDWMTGEFSGVSLTQKSFANHLGVVGDFILIFSASEPSLVVIIPPSPVVMAFLG